MPLNVAYVDFGCVDTDVTSADDDAMILISGQCAPVISSRPEWRAPGGAAIRTELPRLVFLFLKIRRM